jgi:hypothetical protein
MRFLPIRNHASFSSPRWKINIVFFGLSTEESVSQSVSHNPNITLNILLGVLLTQYCAGDKIEKNDMGGTGSADGGGERRVYGFGEETQGKETTGETQA